MPMQVVLVFYREAWCPRWNLTPATYQTLLLPQLTDRGVALVAVNPQTPTGRSARREERLTFSVVTEAGNTSPRTSAS